MLCLGDSYQREKDVMTASEGVRAILSVNYSVSLWHFPSLPLVVSYLHLYLFNFFLNMMYD